MEKETAQSAVFLQAYQRLIQQTERRIKEEEELQKLMIEKEKAKEEAFYSQKQRQLESNKVYKDILDEQFKYNQVIKQKQSIIKKESGFSSDFNMYPNIKRIDTNERKQR